ncbi:MAG: Hsp20/alpha crystallin family protein [Anaerolineae bacterium]|nr:Hsp20/alpha crystallin family protein [Anaerolineae bacterium]
MALTRWEPFREMMSLRRAMNRLFDEGFTRSLRETPWRETDLSLALDMYEEDDHLVVTADLPGVKPEDVDISVQSNMLTIKGEFGDREEKERDSVYFQERRYGAFSRTVSLPSNVNPEEIDATCEDGVLRLEIPIKEEAKPKRITVKAK